MQPRSKTIFHAVLLGLMAALSIPVFVMLRPSQRVAIAAGVAKIAASPKLQFTSSRIPDSTAALSRITNTQIVDFDQDGKNEVLVCDAARNAVLLYENNGDGRWDERVMFSPIMRPAHATVVDVDKDGLQDLVVAVLGDLWPSDELIGQVLLLRNTGDRFEKHVLLDDIRRVADVQPGDFDGDGDVDLAVGVFGYLHGEVLWLENRGDLSFRDHKLLDRVGIIHVPVGDLDGDGDPDIAAVSTQDEEEVWIMENLGTGDFIARRIYFTHNFDVGGAGLVMRDLDQDGDPDFLLPQGDNLELPYPWPQPYHGCLWLENCGQWKFVEHRIATFGGTYAADTSDLDADGDLDIVLVSMANAFYESENPSIVWLENDGAQNFRTWKVDHRHVELITVACGDIDNDGRPEIVAGGLDYPSTSYGRVNRLSVWKSSLGKP